jgi:AcrR family transcriptional regulator
MTRLRLVATAPGLGVVEPSLAPERLPPGRHGLPADIVRTHQRQRLLEAAAVALAEQGYGRLTAARVTELAGVSSRTFYQHFEDLWACLLATYEAEAALLCRRIEEACDAVAGEDGLGGARTGIGAAIDFLAGEPAVARLLCAEPPPQIVALAAARRELVERLGKMLRAVLEPGAATPLPGLERRLIGAAMALVAARAASGEPERLRALEPELGELLLASL